MRAFLARGGAESAVQYQKVVAEVKALDVLMTNKHVSCISSASSQASDALRLTYHSSVLSDQDRHPYSRLHPDARPTLPFASFLLRQCTLSHCTDAGTCHNLAFLRPHKSLILQYTDHARAVKDVRSRRRAEFESTLTTRPMRLDGPPW